MTYEEALAYLDTNELGNMPEEECDAVDDLSNTLFKPLCSRETRVLGYLAAGMSQPAIAKKMGIPLGWVKSFKRTGEAKVAKAKKWEGEQLCL